MEGGSYDVIIVGGGFAGSIAANVLAKDSQLRILIIDLKKKPGYPATTTGGVLKAWFDRVGYHPSGDMIAASLRGVDIVAPDGGSESRRFEDPFGYVLNPDRYIEWLIEKASAKSVDILPNTKVNGVSFSTDHIAVKTSRAKM